MRVQLMRQLTWPEYQRLSARQRQLLDQQLRRNEERIKRLAPLHTPERTPRQILEDDLANHARRNRSRPEQPVQEGDSTTPTR